ncbi:MAG TPA: hypothetical protein VEF89_28530 [Solirubrobacteraceae bacterium]|nr:hypothetical protein [Solirubrobacteraceae bacterium]
MQPEIWIWVIVWVVIVETTGVGLEGAFDGWGSAGESAGCGSVPGAGPETTGAGPEGGVLVPLGDALVPLGGVVAVVLPLPSLPSLLLVVVVVTVGVAGGADTVAGGVEASTAVDVATLGFVAAGEDAVVAADARPGVVAGGDALGAVGVWGSLTGVEGALGPAD